MSSVPYFTPSRASSQWNRSEPSSNESKLASEIPSNLNRLLKSNLLQQFINAIP
jgi:hypothetical protein